MFRTMTTAATMKTKSLSCARAPAPQPRAAARTGPSSAGGQAHLCVGVDLAAVQVEHAVQQQRRGQDSYLHHIDAARGCARHLLGGRGRGS